jgi:hypothetical protein
LWQRLATTAASLSESVSNCRLLASGNKLTVYCHYSLKYLYLKDKFPWHANC